MHNSQVQQDGVRYHINDNYEIRVCKASLKNCPYTRHYLSQADADSALLNLITDLRKEARETGDFNLLLEKGYLRNAVREGYDNPQIIFLGSEDNYVKFEAIHQYKYLIDFLEDDPDSKVRNAAYIKMTENKAYVDKQYNQWEAEYKNTLDKDNQKFDDYKTTKLYRSEYKPIIKYSEEEAFKDYVLYKKYVYNPYNKRYVAQGFMLSSEYKDRTYTMSTDEVIKPSKFKKLVQSYAEANKDILTKDKDAFIEYNNGKLQISKWYKSANKARALTKDNEQYRTFLFN